MLKSGQSEKIGAHCSKKYFLAYSVILSLSQLEKQSETADLRQRHVVRQVAAPHSVWQRFPLCPIESNVNENFKAI